MPVPEEEVISRRKESDSFGITMEYAFETILLSRCDMILSTGYSGQNYMPLIMSDKEIRIIHEPFIVEMYR